MVVTGVDAQIECLGAKEDGLGKDIMIALDLSFEKCI